MFPGDKTTDDTEDGPTPTTEYPGQPTAPSKSANQLLTKRPNTVTNIKVINVPPAKKTTAKPGGVIDKPDGKTVTYKPGTNTKAPVTGKPGFKVVTLRPNQKTPFPTSKPGSPTKKHHIVTKRPSQGSPHPIRRKLKKQPVGPDTLRRNETQPDGVTEHPDYEYVYEEGTTGPPEYYYIDDATVQPGTYTI